MSWCHLTIPVARWTWRGGIGSAFVRFLPTSTVYSRPVTYTPDFFKAISASASESAAVLLPCVFELVGTPTSILDVGCGTGAWLATARELGVAEIIGVDGDYLPPEQLVISPSEFVAGDLTKPLDLQRRFDVVMTLEVAEHLDELA